MNIRHIMKITGSVALSAILATATLPVTVNAEEKDENPTEKTETVYSVLNGDGSVSDIVVSSWLHDEDGIKNLKEKLNLTDVRNVKTDETPEENNGEYTWNSDSNDVYYQGKATEKLPVSVKITYELDGQEISESDLDGKTGHLKIRIHMTNENSETKTINGKDIIIHPCFVTGGMMTLNNDHVANVKCEQGKIVSDGSSQFLVFAAVPGLKETLDSADLSKVSDEMKVGDDVEIECDVTDYENAGLMMGMSDELDISDVIGEVDSLDELTDGINQLMDADDQLIDGAKQLEEGTQTLITESEPLTSSSGSIRVLSNGAVTLNEGALRLKAALAQYTGGVSQLNAGVSALDAIPQGAKKISDGSTSLVDGSSSLTEGLEKMKKQVEDGMSGAGMTPEAMRTMASDLATANQILSDMSGMIDTELTTLQKLNDSLTATVGGLDQLKTTMGASYDSISYSLTSALTTLNKLYYYGNLDEDSKATIKDAIDNLTAQAGNLQAAFGDVNKTVDAVPNTASSMMGTLNEAIKALQGMQDDIKDAQDGLGQLTEILTRSSSTLNNLGSMMTQLNRLNSGLDQLIAGSKQIQAGVTAVNAGVQQLEEQSQAGIDQVKAATSTLAGNNDALNSGMSSLQEGTQSIADQSGSFNEMADGLDTLKSAFETLHDGAKQLSDGQQQFRDEGLNELKEKVDLSVDEINMLKDIMDEVSAMNKEYREYAGDNEDYEVVTRYVFRTKTAESSK